VLVLGEPSVIYGTRLIRQLLGNAGGLVRLVGIPDRPLFDWRALARLEAVLPDGLTWNALTERPAPTEDLDMGVLRSQLVVGELIAGLADAGVTVEGWTSERRNIGAAIREETAGTTCRSVTILARSSARRLPVPLVRRAAKGGLATRRRGAPGTQVIRHPRVTATVFGDVVPPDRGGPPAAVVPVA
jgi:hypothetical protein